MNFIEIFKSSVQCLKSNKMRSFLTMLGIIIGISSVIAMSGIGKGGEKKITGNLAQSGFGVYQISVDSDADNYRSVYELEDDDINLLKNSEINMSVAPRLNERIFFRTANNKNIRGSISGTDEDFEKIEEINYLFGRGISKREYNEKSSVIVIDHITAKTLFPNTEYPIGEIVRVRIPSINIIKEFTLVGIFEHPDAGMLQIGLTTRLPSFGRISVSLLNRILGESEYNSILIKPDNPLEATEILGKTINRLEGRNDKGIYEYEERVARGSAFKEVLSTLNIFVTFVASISLFVGGIGVMNIMLVSVTERIKEIGIRKAIGARNIHILLQFLTEAIILSLTGGILGILTGYSIAEIIGVIIDIEPIISLNIVTISLIISTAIGVIFGVYPARKASLMNPIDALRNE